MRIFLLLFIILINFLLTIKNYASEKTDKIVLPNFLIENQLAYEVIGVEYSGFNFISGKFKSNDVELGNLNRIRTISTSGFPVALMNKTDNQIYMGYRYNQEKFSSDFDFDNSDLYHYISINSFWEYSLGNNFHLFSFYQISLSGNEPFKNLNDNIIHLFYEKINYKLSDNMNIGLGIIFASNFEKGQFLPAISFCYYKNNFIYNIDIPQRIEIEYLANNNLRIHSGINLNTSNYNIYEDNYILNYSGLSSYIGLRYRIYKAFFLFFNGQYNLGENYNDVISKNLSVRGRLENNFNLIIGLKLQLTKKHD